MSRSLVVICAFLVAVELGACTNSFQPSAAPVTAPSQPVTVPKGVPSASSDTGTPAPTVLTSMPPTTAQPTLTVFAPAVTATPSWLSIPTVGINESIAPMGLTKSGEIEPPQRQTIWYTGSPKPGAPGISVVAGHVEFSGPDNFWRLDEVPIGATITIRYSDDTQVRFVVSHKRSELKLAVQTDAEVWGTSKTPNLVLITCDKRSPVVSHHHLNNFLILASPV